MSVMALMLMIVMITTLLADADHHDEFDDGDAGDFLMVGEDERDEGDDDDAACFLRTRPPLRVYLLKRALLVRASSGARGTSKTGRSEGRAWHSLGPRNGSPSPERDLAEPGPTAGPTKLAHNPLHAHCSPSGPAP